MFCNIVSFYCEDLLAPRPSSKLEDQLFSVVRDCLFNIFAATLHIGGGGRAMLQLQEHTYHGLLVTGN